jgi:hypothetical protein
MAHESVAVASVTVLHCVHTHYTVAKPRPRNVVRHGHCWSCSPGSTHKPPRVSAGGAGTVGPQCVVGEPWTGDQPPRAITPCRTCQSERAALRQPAGGDTPHPGSDVGGHGPQPRVDAQRRGNRRRVRPRRRRVVNGRPSTVSPLSVSQRSLLTLGSNSPASRGFWTRICEKFALRSVHQPLHMRTVATAGAFRNWPEQLGDVAPNGAHCQGQSPGRLSADGLGTLPFSG